MIPTAALERALDFGFPVIPFLRALSVGDAETASRLGCLEMVEEDLAAVSLACTSGADYGRMLRHVLDELAEDA
jgi:Na+-transporting NADH:ubiquinone oxidoreductase subunit A